MLVPLLQILFPLNASAFTLSPSLLLVLLRFMSALQIGFSKVFTVNQGSSLTCTITLIFIVTITTLTLFGL